MCNDVALLLTVVSLGIVSFLFLFKSKFQRLDSLAPETGTICIDWAHLIRFFALGVASCCASVQLVLYDAFNRNKVSIH
jgi:hypothetical protein